MKKIRKAVRTFLIKDNKVVTIKYTTGINKDHYDIPGGKIEEGETPVATAIREFKEETGIDIYNPKYTGNLIVEYPDRIYDFDVFMTSEYEGTPQQELENTAEWITIDKLLQKEKKFSEIYLLDDNHINSLIKNQNFNYHFISDMNHNKIDEIIYTDPEKFWNEHS